MKRVGDVVQGREVYSVRADQPVREVARYMAERDVGAVAVVEGERLTGIVSERDILKRVVAPALDPDQVTAAQIMTRQLAVCAAADSHEAALRAMRQARCRHLPVLQGERFLGLVSQRDLLQIDVSEKNDEIRWLTAYIQDDARPS